MKLLIINADDFGADDCRNQGIDDAVNAGIVTSVSILVNGTAFEDAVARLASWQDRGVSLGLHVNLSEGRPICKGLTILADKNGYFRGKPSAHSMLMQKGNKELELEVAQELEAQIKHLESKAVRVSHLDGHQHVHIFPAVIAAAVQAAQRHGIAWLRIPEETSTVPPASGEKKLACCNNEKCDIELNHDHSESLCREAAAFSDLAAAARPFLKHSCIETTDHFRGLYLKGRLSFSRLEKLLNDLPVGLTELMVHPGRAPATTKQGTFAAFSNADREEELAVLLKPELTEAFKEKGVSLIPYPEDRV
jgi:predicted glycoside hydrolase/deacetylase ChbG (UPF0249 family)